LHRIIGFILGAVALATYYFLFLNEINWVSVARYIGASIFLYLSFFYIPWISRKDGYEYYIIDVLTRFIVTVVYSFVLFVGIVIILFTIVQLFDVMLPEKLVLYIFITIVGIFALPLFLARIPEINREYHDEQYPKV